MNKYSQLEELANDYDLAVAALWGESTPIGTNQSVATKQPLDQNNYGQYYQSPLRGNAKLVSRFTPGIASQNHPSGHFGIDLGQEKGSPVYSIGPGIVNSTGVDPKGGNYVTTYHEDGKIHVYYAHLNSINVKSGQQINSESIIGTVGNTGNASHTAPHLHYEVSINGKKVDPLGLNGTMVGRM